MKRGFMSFLLAVVTGLTLMASEPFIGTLRSTNGRALKGIKVFVDNPKEAVKSDKNGEYSVSVRGGSPMWILDGIRMSEMPDLTVMEVEKIEVLHDGGMYGIGGFGGVVNITTKGSNF